MEVSPGLTTLFRRAWLGLFAEERVSLYELLLFELLLNIVKERVTHFLQSEEHFRRTDAAIACRRALPGLLLGGPPAANSEVKGR